MTAQKALDIDGCSVPRRMVVNSLCSRLTKTVEAVFLS